MSTILARPLSGDSSVHAVCGCRGLTSHFHRYFHQNKQHGLDRSVELPVNALSRRMMSQTSAQTNSGHVKSCPVVQQCKLECPPTPQFSLNFFLRSKTYLKECLPSASIANREFPQLEDLVRLVYTRYKLHITLLHSGLHQYKVLSPQCHALFALLHTLCSAKY